VFLQNGKQEGCTGLAKVGVLFLVPVRRESWERKGIGGGM
jgi:hypothetical protein